MSDATPSATAGFIVAGICGGLMLGLLVIAGQVFLHRNKSMQDLTNHNGRFDTTAAPSLKSSCYARFHRHLCEWAAGADGEVLRFYIAFCQWILLLSCLIADSWSTVQISTGSIGSVSFVITGLFSFRLGTSWRDMRFNNVQSFTTSCGSFQGNQLM
jgi:hypothetical protein